MLIFKQSKGKKRLNDRSNLDIKMGNLDCILLNSFSLLESSTSVETTVFTIKLR